MQKRKIKIVLSAFFIMALSLTLTGCGDGSKNNNDKKNGGMGDINRDYKNNNLGFELKVPDIVEFYTTQRNEGENYTEIEFFIPTGDKNYPTNEVNNYAKPIVVRVFEGVGESEISNDNYQVLEEKDGKIYAIKFWDKTPKDWQDKWTGEVEESVKNSFRLK